METLKFKTNINCGGCVAAVKPAINQIDGIKNWEVNTESSDKILTVELSQSESKSALIDAVKKSGFEISELN